MSTAHRSMKTSGVSRPLGFPSPFLRPIPSATTPEPVHTIRAGSPRMPQKGGAGPWITSHPWSGLIPLLPEQSPAFPTLEVHWAFCFRCLGHCGSKAAGPDAGEAHTFPQVALSPVAPQPGVPVPTPGACLASRAGQLAREHPPSPSHGSPLPGPQKPCLLLQVGPGQQPSLGTGPLWGGIAAGILTLEVWRLGGEPQARRRGPLRGRLTAVLALAESIHLIEGAALTVQNLSTTREPPWPPG